MGVKGPREQAGSQGPAGALGQGWAQAMSESREPGPQRSSQAEASPWGRSTRLHGTPTAPCTLGPPGPPAPGRPCAGPGAQGCWRLHLAVTFPPKHRFRPAPSTVTRTRRWLRDKELQPATRLGLSLQGERGPPGVNGTQGFQGCPGQRGMKVQCGVRVWVGRVAAVQRGAGLRAAPGGPGGGQWPEPRLELGDQGALQRGLRTEKSFPVEARRSQGHS